VDGWGSKGCGTDGGDLMPTLEPKFVVCVGYYCECIHGILLPSSILAGISIAREIHTQRYLPRTLDPWTQVKGVEVENSYSSTTK